jgi:Spy/CpxP family protein refolding chaperone
MKKVTLAISALAVFAFTAGVAAAQMQPIPNPPENHMMSHHHVKQKHHMSKHHGKTSHGMIKHSMNKPK